MGNVKWSICFGHRVVVKSSHPVELYIVRSWGLRRWVASDGPVASLFAHAFNFMTIITLAFRWNYSALHNSKKTMHFGQSLRSMLLLHCELLTLVRNESQSLQGSCDVRNTRKSSRVNVTLSSIGTFYTGHSDRYVGSPLILLDAFAAHLL